MAKLPSPSNGHKMSDSVEPFEVANCSTRLQLQAAKIWGTKPLRTPSNGCMPVSVAFESSFSVQTHLTDGQEDQGFLLKRRDFL